MSDEESTADSDHVLDQLLGVKGLAIESLSGLDDRAQQPGFSYLDPDFDIGIPSLHLPKDGKESPASSSGASTSYHKALKNKHKEDGMPPPFLGLRTCSDDEDLEVHHTLTRLLANRPELSQC